MYDTSRVFPFRRSSFRVVLSLWYVHCWDPKSFTPADVSLQANAVTLETKDTLDINATGDVDITCENANVTANTKITLTGKQGSVEIE